MRTTIDRAGRIVIPSSIRKEAGLAPGTLLQVGYRDGRVEIEPEPLPVRLVRKGKMVIAMPMKPVRKMSAQIVRDTIERLRTGRR